MLIITEEQIRTIYTMRECIVDVENAFHYQMEGKESTPIRTSVLHSKYNANTLYMTSYVEGIDHTAAKIVSIFPQNVGNGLPSLQSVTLLTDATNGRHVALLNASYLTVLRTGAISGIGTKYLARKDARVCTVLGCGAQSIGQIMAMMEVCLLEKIILYNRTISRAEKVKEQIRSLYPTWKGKIEIFTNPNEAVALADLLICSSKSETPLFNGQFLKEGTHINAIGSYQPHMQELDLTTLKRSNKVVADTREGVLHEAGDLLIPLERGEWSLNQLYGELGEIVTGKKVGRENKDEITLLKSVGVAFIDTVVAHSVYQKAKAMQIGTEVDL